MRISIKLFIIVFLTGLLFTISSTSIMAQMPTLDSKYQKLELKASKDVKLQLNKMRAIGKKNNWTFQVGNTSVTKYIINNDIKALTGAQLPTIRKSRSSAPPSANSTAALNTGINANASSMDLRSKGYTSTVRDQGGCGSCWAFCSTACIETAQIIRNGTNRNSINLSEQYVLSCSGAGSCGGGQPHKVFKHFKDNGKGCPNDNTFAYSARDLSCQASPAFSDYKVESWGWVGSSNSHATVQEVKNALARYGAVETYIWVNSSFGSYTNGIINDNSRTGWGGWHCVQIVGWNDATQAYLIKNSWGTNWGMNGYAWVKNNVLSIGDWAAWVKAKKKETFDLNGYYYSSHNRGHYYVRHIGNEVYWFGENANGNWANVFKGTLNGDSVTGYYWDVPKGRTAGKGSLELKARQGGKYIDKLSGPSAGTTLTRTNLPSTLPGQRAAGYSQAGNINDMDGAWKCNDKGTYYIREVGGKIIWFGEGGLNSKGKPVFANVAVGNRSGNTIRLDWADVPKCGMKGKGKLTLKINSANEIVRTAGGGFGGSKWTRSGSLDGVWKNKDANTRGITKFVISANQTKIQTYGSCSPKDCDWGKVNLSKSGSNCIATYKPSFATKKMTISPYGSGQLKVTLYTDYKDNRTDKTVVYYFKK